MSDFVKQNISICSFSNEESWSILSPIEQSIANKINSIGVALKNWDIKIYRGILTGYNDAFIISTNKRDEILSNCATESERKKTAELIRPILRGRDIKRYKYEWADLWLIATFPSRHYDISEYPAIEKHLLTFDKKRLEQSGKKYIINGEQLKARKKTNNKWFETQDSISYWDDFNKPKIFWAELARTGNSFVFTEENIMALAGVFLMTMSPEFEEKIGYEFLTMFLNCPISLFYFDMIYSKLDETGWQWKKEPIEKLPVPQISKDKQIKFLELFETLNDKSLDFYKQMALISIEFFKMYNFSNEEIKTIYERTIVFNDEYEIVRSILN